ncbi:hypothetical protein ACWGJ2_15020 [Streptomyces sp. NPDC054796]
MSRTEKQVVVTITAATVHQGDVINVGGVPMTVLNLLDIAGGAKRIEFGDGEALVIRAGTTLTALRTAKGW